VYLNLSSTPTFRRNFNEHPIIHNHFATFRWICI
jgi:hypothetical protein